MSTLALREPSAGAFDVLANYWIHKIALADAGDLETPAEHVLSDGGAVGALFSYLHENFDGRVLHPDASFQLGLSIANILQSSSMNAEAEIRDAIAWAVEQSVKFAEEA